MKTARTPISMAVGLFLVVLCIPVLVAARLSGTLVDNSGKPIDKARIDHLGKPVIVPPPDASVEPAEANYQTAANGYFEIVTPAPAVVIRKPVHRMRQKYRNILRAEIAETVSMPEEIDEEIRFLLSTLKG